MARILIIGGWPRSLVNFRGNLIDELKDRGHEVIPCAGGEDSSVKEWLSHRGIPYYSLPLDRTGINPIKDLLLLCKIYFLIQKIKPDIVLGYTIKPVVYGLIAARLCHVSIRYAMITGLGSTFLESRTLKQKLVGKLVPWMYKIALKDCRNVFFQNKEDRNKFLNKKIISSHVKYSVTNGSGVDIDYFHPSMPQSLCVSSLKDFGLLAQVF